MARIRSVKPQLRTSFTVAEWPREVRYFWVLLWGYLDDRGRGIDDPRLIKSDCFPLDDDVTGAVVDDWIALIAKTPEENSDLPTLCRYEVRGRHYVHAPKWTDHQKPQYVKESELPECPLHDSVENPEDSQSGSEENLKKILPVVGVVEGEGEGVGVGEGARPSDAPRERAAEPGKPKPVKPKPAPKGSRLPEDFQVTPDMVTWAKANTPNVNGRRETERFCNYWWTKTGKDATKVKWALAWRNWMLKAQEDTERHGANRSRGSPGPKPSTTDQRVDAALALAAEFRTEANGQLGIAS